MKICDMKGLEDRICQEYGFTQKAAQDKAEQIVKNCPVVLAKNLEELEVLEERMIRHG